MQEKKMGKQIGKHVSAALFLACLVTAGMNANAGGHAVSHDQLAQPERFRQVTPGVTTKQEILAMFGAPADISRYALSGLTALQYPYRESGVWDSAMSIYFDDKGVVQRMESGPDPWRYQGSGGGIGS
jgi:hypothetical protein